MSKLITPAVARAGAITAVNASLSACVLSGWHCTLKRTTIISVPPMWWWSSAVEPSGRDNTLISEFYARQTTESHSSQLWSPGRDRRIGRVYDRAGRDGRPRPHVSLGLAEPGLCRTEATARAGLGDE